MLSLRRLGLTIYCLSGRNAVSIIIGRDLYCGEGTPATPPPRIASAAAYVSRELNNHYSASAASYLSRKLKKRGRNRLVHVVGFDLDYGRRRDLNCLVVSEPPPRIVSRLPSDGKSNSLVRKAQIPKVEAMSATVRPIFVVRGAATRTILTTASIMPPGHPRSPMTIVPNVFDNLVCDVLFREHRGRGGNGHNVDATRKICHSWSGRDLEESKMFTTNLGQSCCGTRGCFLLIVTDG